MSRDIEQTTPAISGEVIGRNPNQDWVEALHSVLDGLPAEVRVNSEVQAEQALESIRRNLITLSLVLGAEGAQRVLGPFLRAQSPRNVDGRPFMASRSRRQSPPKN